MAPSLETKTTIQTMPTAEDISLAFAEANHQLAYRLQDPAFEERCRSVQLDPANTEDPAYWDEFANHIYAHTAAERAIKGDSLALRALELLVEAAPSLLQDLKLNAEGYVPEEPYRYAKQVVSYFNSKVREFATLFPAVRTSDIVAALAQASQLAIHDPETQAYALHQLQAVVRGAQTELAYEQILRHTDHHFSLTTHDQDLHGTDVIVQDPGFAELDIDIKSSMRSRHEGRREKLGYVRHTIEPDHIVMQGMTTQDDFDDSFFISEELALKRAPKLERIINGSEHRLYTTA